MINPSIKNMAETDVLQIPKALYQRLEKLKCGNN